MRRLLIDDALREACSRLRAHAHDPAHWYRLGKSTVVPGDMPEHVLSLPEGFRVVFSVTEAPEYRPRPFRHLSVSVDGPNYPHPIAVWTLADLLGFTGAEMTDAVVVGPGPWAMDIDKTEHCIVVQQPLEDA